MGIYSKLLGDTGKRADLKWFARHPGRAYRVRAAKRAEIAEYQLLPGGLPPLPERHRWCVVVWNKPQAGPHRLLTYLPDWVSIDGLGEAECFAVWRAVATQMRQWAQANEVDPKALLEAT